jgi:hypothetical protein
MSKHYFVIFIISQTTLLLLERNQRVLCFSRVKVAELPTDNHACTVGGSMPRPQLSARRLGDGLVYIWSPRGKTEGMGKKRLRLSVRYSLTARLTVGIPKETLSVGTPHSCGIVARLIIWIFRLQVEGNDGEEQSLLRTRITRGGATIVDNVCKSYVYVKVWHPLHLLYRYCCFIVYGVCFFGWHFARLMFR